MELTKELDDILAANEARQVEVQAEIDRVASELTKELRTLKKEHLLTTCKRIGAIMKIVHDEDAHIYTRFDLWSKHSTHDTSSWLIEEGPLRNQLFDEGNRYATYSVVNYLSDYISDLGIHDTESYDNYEPEKQSNQWITAPEKDDLVAIIEDAIRMNVDEFTYDW